MREIKFRAWDIRNKVMEYIDDFNWFEERGVHDSEGVGNYEKYTLMQYTGLKDKNGVEIYEGDILSECNDGIENAKVRYDDTDAMFVLEFDNIILNFSNENSKWFEVFGNKYENPELVQKLGDEIKKEMGV
jgi:hypothetical protein